MEHGTKRDQGYTKRGVEAYSFGVNADVRGNLPQRHEADWLENDRRGALTDARPLVGERSLVRRLGPRPLYQVPDEPVALEELPMDVRCFLSNVRAESLTWLFMLVIGFTVGMGFVAGPLAWMKGAEQREAFRHYGLAPPAECEIVYYGGVAASATMAVVIVLAALLFGLGLVLRAGGAGATASAASPKQTRHLSEEPMNPGRDAVGAPLPHVVIVGGGFAGLRACRELRRARCRVTLLDRKNHHLFQPLLYQVATAGLSAAEIAEPIRDIVRRQKNATVLMGEVTAIDTSSGSVTLDGVEALSYDYLVVASGVTHSYFGHPEWAVDAPGLKTIEDALDIRRRVLLAYERAERTADAAMRAQQLTFVVVGGGPTGVELAGALREIAVGTMSKNFRRFDPRDVRVLLVEGGERLLGPYDERLSASAKRQLESLGVEVRLGAFVTNVGAEFVELGSERIACGTVLWGAGVRGSSLGALLGGELDRAGRVLVTPQLTLPGNERVYVVGDLAALEQDGAWLPGVAQNAMQGGTYVGRRIRSELGGGDVSEGYRYRDKGSMATIGRRRAVVESGRLRVSGGLAWLMWAFVHVAFLIGFRNRVVVMVDWVVSYLFFRRGARVIASPPARIMAGLGSGAEGAAVQGEGAAAESSES